MIHYDQWRIFLAAKALDFLIQEQDDVEQDRFSKDFFQFFTLFSIYSGNTGWVRGGREPSLLTY